MIERLGVRTCSTCGEVYRDESDVCRVDGAPLRTWLGLSPFAAPPPGDDGGAREPAPGRVLAGRYRLDEAAGAGGFGARFAAWDLQEGKPVTVKVLSPVVAARPGVERMHGDAVAAGRAGHAGLGAVTDFDYDREADGTRFVVHEELPARDLAAVLAEARPMAPARALDIVAQAARAVAAAHAAGLVHGDLKPESLLVAEGGAVKVVDFGLASLAHAPWYRAPEQASDADGVDARADVFALGGVLYELLTGVPPFPGASHDAIVGRRLLSRPVQPSKVNPALQPALEVDQVVMRALARHPVDRYRSMEVFADALLRLRERLGRPATAAAPAAPETFWEKWRHLGLATALASAVLLFAWVVASVDWGPSYTTHRPPAPEDERRLLPRDWSARVLPPLRVTLARRPAGASVTLDGKAVAGVVVEVPRDGMGHVVAMRAGSCTSASTIRADPVELQRTVDLSCGGPGGSPGPRAVPDGIGGPGRPPLTDPARKR